jgi:hypothetical protein
MTLQIKERQVARDTTVGCGHTVAKGGRVFYLTFVCCSEDTAHVYQSIRACFQALSEKREWKPPFSYRLWHATIGKLMQKKSA